MKQKLDIIDNNLLIFGEDIINTISENITDAEILIDIIDSLETKVASNVRKGIPSSIPYIGTVVINENKVDARNNREIMEQAKKDFANNPRGYKNFRTEFIATRFKHNGKYRSMGSIARHIIVKNMKRAKRLYKEGHNELFVTIDFFFLSQLEPIDYIEDGQQ